MKIKFEDLKEKQFYIVKLDDSSWDDAIIKVDKKYPKGYETYVITKPEESDLGLGYTEIENDSIIDNEAHFIHITKEKNPEYFL